MKRRPNILLVMTDQQRADSLGHAHGGETLTPHLDALAAKGTVFENAYSGATVCVPARASLLTGLLPHRVVTADDGLTLKEGQWTIAWALRAHGYQTALFGKMHFQPMRADHGFELSELCEHLSPGAGYSLSAVDDYRQWLVSQGKTDKRFHRASQPTVFPYDAEYHPTSWITRRAIDFLRNRRDDRPYFAVVSYAHPHTPYDPPEPYASRFRPEDVVLPVPGLEANDDLPPAFHRAVFEGDRPGGFYPTRLPEVPEGYVRRVLASIRALIAHIDDAVDTLMEHVDLDDTFVWFTSDHGDFGGHRGLLAKIPWIPFDDLARVPTFCIGADVSHRGRMGHPVQSFDFCPTALELARARRPDFEFDGRTLASALAGHQAFDADRPVFCATSQGWPMFRLGSLKHIWHPHSGASVLYDMATDPHETKNLWRQSELQSFLEKSRAMLERALAQERLDTSRKSP